MNHFQTKYGIGDVLYAPRCYKERMNDVIEVDGKTYVHSYEVLLPTVKKKIVTGVLLKVRLDGSQSVSYEIDDDGIFLRPEEYLDKMHIKLEAARAVAQKAFEDGVELF